MPRIIGLELRLAPPGGAQVEMAILPCRIDVDDRLLRDGAPLDGSLTFHTTAGDATIQFGNVGGLRLPCETANLDPNRNGLRGLLVRQAGKVLSLADL